MKPVQTKNYVLSSKIYFLIIEYSKLGFVLVSTVLKKMFRFLCKMIINADNFNSTLSTLYRSLRCNSVVVA